MKLIVAPSLGDCLLGLLRHSQSSIETPLGIPNSPLMMAHTLLLRILVAFITYKMGSLSMVGAQAQSCNTGGLDLAVFFFQAL